MDNSNTTVIRKRGQHGKNTIINYHYVNTLTKVEKDFTTIDEIANAFDLSRQTIYNIINHRPAKNAIVQEVYNAITITRITPLNGRGKHLRKKRELN